MGGIQSKEDKNKNNNPCEKHIVKGLREKVRLLEKEVNEVKSMRENESQAYEKEMVVHAFKEAEWKRERKRLREEVKKLRKKLEEREEEEEEEEEEEIRVRLGGGMGDDGGRVVVLGGERAEKDHYYLDWLPPPPPPPLVAAGTAASYFVEKMREERASRDEAVEKWKKLYLAIKIELDDLIQRTHQGERLYWREEEEDLMEKLQRELKIKEETIELLKARLALMEQEESNREREVDILRQSLKIMSYKKKSTVFCQEPPKKLAFGKRAHMRGI
ncbi:hypothetical protein CsSME_00020517 [Camellia sinensis var. sinensis]